MKKILTLILISVVILGPFTNSAFADPSKGQKIYIKKMKKPCGFNGAEMSKKHTQQEWKDLFDAGKLNEELLNFCPEAKPLKDKYLEHVFDFLYNYASDSGNVPTC